MIIHVTQDHIARGEYAECATCPVALAVREYNPQLYVGASCLFFNEQEGFPFGEHCIANLDLETQEWITDFDSHCKPKPFSFHLSAECFMR